MTAANRETLEEIREKISDFLVPRGLKLSEEKTLITHIDDGFEFLGWNFRKYKGKLIIKPSRKSVEKVTKAISRIIKDNHTAPQEMLIRKLNEVTKDGRITTIQHVQRAHMGNLTTGYGKCYGNGQKGDTQTKENTG